MYEKLNQCPICHSPNFSNFMVVKDHAVSQESFSISKCQDCGFLFTNPRPDPESIEQYYRSEHYISHADKASNLTNFAYKIVRTITLRQKVKWLNTFTRTKGKLLDYGCGTGSFLNAAKKDGWEVTGFEPNRTASEAARKKYNLDVLESSNELESRKKFDAITLFHVLEHIHDLDTSMDLLLSKLKRRGVLFIAVPNHYSVDYQIYKEYWAALDVPRHLYHFTPQTFEKLAKKHGLKIRNTLPLTFDSYYASLLSEKYKGSKNPIINAIKNGYLSNQLGKKEKNKYSSLLFVLSKI